MFDPFLNCRRVATLTELIDAVRRETIRTNIRGLGDRLAENANSVNKPSYLIEPRPAGNKVVRSICQP
jgi:hypothetical protein